MPTLEAASASVPSVPEQVLEGLDCPETRVSGQRLVDVDDKRRETSLAGEAVGTDVTPAEGRGDGRGEGRRLTEVRQGPERRETTGGTGGGTRRRKGWRT